MMLCNDLSLSLSFLIKLLGDLILVTTPDVKESDIGENSTKPPQWLRVGREREGEGERGGGRGRGRERAMERYDLALKCRAFAVAITWFVRSIPIMSE